MGSLHYGCHLPAFLLLFLAKKPDYGPFLLQRTEAEMPIRNEDGPAVYHALNELGKCGVVTSSWDASSVDAAKKCHTITAVGCNQLADFKVDFEQRKLNPKCFLASHEKLPTGDGKR